MRILFCLLPSCDSGGEQVSSNEIFNRLDNILHSIQLITGCRAKPLRWWKQVHRQLCRTGPTAPVVETGILQLSPEVQPLLGIFGNRVSVGFPLQFLRDCGSQEFHSYLVQYGKGGVPCPVVGDASKGPKVISIVLMVFSSRVLGLCQRTADHNLISDEVQLLIDLGIDLWAFKVLCQASVMSCRRTNTSLSKTLIIIEVRAMGQQSLSHLGYKGFWDRDDCGKFDTVGKNKHVYQMCTSFFDDLK